MCQCRAVRFHWPVGGALMQCFKAKNPSGNETREGEREGKGGRQRGSCSRHGYPRYNRPLRAHTTSLRQENTLSGVAIACTCVSLVTCFHWAHCKIPKPFILSVTDSIAFCKNVWKLAYVLRWIRAQIDRNIASILCAILSQWGWICFTLSSYED